MSTHTCKQTYIRTYILKKLCVYVYIYIYIHKVRCRVCSFQGRGCIARGLRFRSLLGGRERFHPPHVRVGIVGMAAGESHGCGRGDLDLI